MTGINKWKIIIALFTILKRDEQVHNKYWIETHLSSYFNCFMPIIIIYLLKMEREKKIHFHPENTGSE